MDHDWLLVETLGAEPVVVAKGDRLKQMVPISAFLRKNPHLAAVRTAVAETVSAKVPLTSLTPKSDRVIRTEPIQMSDGVIHGVHLWLGPATAEPPDRPIPGTLTWDLTAGVATDTPESLRNMGLDPNAESTHGRAFAEDLPARTLNDTETHALSLAIAAEPGATFCDSWDIIDHDGSPMSVSFVARNLLEANDDGTDHLICRCLNWRPAREVRSDAQATFARRLVDGMAEPGSYRALMDIEPWKLLKWLDDPCPLFDWRGRSESPLVHPDDHAAMVTITDSITDRSSSGVLRLRTEDGGWVSLHVTAHRVELDPGVYAALVTIREPTLAERLAAGPS